MGFRDRFVSVPNRSVPIQLWRPISSQQAGTFIPFFTFSSQQTSVFNQSSRQPHFHHATAFRVSGNRGSRFLVPEIQRAWQWLQDTLCSGGCRHCACLTDLFMRCRKDVSRTNILNHLCAKLFITQRELLVHLLTGLGRVFSSGDGRSVLCRKADAFKTPSAGIERSSHCGNDDV